jgi:hypothetical protein
MPWNRRFDEENYEWPLEACVNVEYLMDLSINGIGGWQSLLNSLQTNVDEDEEAIYLDADDVEKIIRYANCYRTGGYQGYLTEIFTDDAVWYFARYHWCDNVGQESHWDNS